MKNLLKTMVVMVALLALTTIPAFSQEWGINFARNAYHITTNTTNTPASATARLYTLIIQVSGAGTSWVIQVKNKEATPKILYNWVTATGAGTFIVPLDIGVVMTGGIDITTTGTTPGTADVFVSYR